jgi:predicted secreted protein
MAEDQGVRDHQLGPDDAGRTIEVAAGDRLVVSLPEIAGTGYTWQVEELPPGAEVVEERFEDVGHAPGAASHHVFVVASPHEAGPVRLRYLRPWAGERTVADRYEVTAAPSRS